MTKKEFLKFRKEILAIPEVKKIDGFMAYQYYIETKYGNYVFVFDYDRKISSIMGRFIDTEKLNENWTQPENAFINGNEYQFIMKPNLFSGKMNFHGSELENFETAIQILITETEPEFQRTNN